MIFGRAGEEIAELEQAGIPVDIVPGISTAFALAAELRLSLTHRDCAQSVRFVTGHARDGQLPAGLDWRGLADPTTTHIYYMAGRTAAALGAQLLQHGLAPETPVVLASDVSRPEQRIVHTQLSELGSCAEKIDLNRPVIIGVGRALQSRNAQHHGQSSAIPA